MVQQYQNIYIQAYVLCISEQKLDRHLEGKAACYKNLRSVWDVIFSLNRLFRTYLYAISSDLFLFGKQEHN